MNYFEVGDNIRRIREEQGLSQEELAELAGVHRVSLARYETGKVDPGTQQIGRIADALGVSVDVLLGKRSVDSNDEDDAWAIRERLRRDPSFRLLFNAADKATPEHLRAAAAVLKALGGNDGDRDE